MYRCLVFSSFLLRSRRSSRRREEKQEERDGEVRDKKVDGTEVEGGREGEWNMNDRIITREDERIQNIIITIYA